MIIYLVSWWATQRYLYTSPMVCEWKVFFFFFFLFPNDPFVFRLSTCMEAQPKNSGSIHRSSTWGKQVWGEGKVFIISVNTFYLERKLNKHALSSSFLKIWFDKHVLSNRGVQNLSSWFFAQKKKFNLQMQHAIEFRCL